MTTFDWVVLSVLLVLVVIAILKDNSLLRTVVMVILLLALVEREFSIGVWARHISWEKGQEWTEQFRDGIMAILDYCKSTRIYLFSIYVLLLLLCIRGFQRPKLNVESQAKSS